MPVLSEALRRADSFALAEVRRRAHRVMNGAGSGAELVLATLCLAVSAELAARGLSPLGPCPACDVTCRESTARVLRPGCVLPGSDPAPLAVTLPGRPQ